MMPIPTNEEEDTQSLFNRITPMLDTMDLKNNLPLIKKSKITQAEMSGNKLTTDSWKLAVLLQQKKITNDEHRRIIDFYAASYFKKTAE